MLTKLRRRAQDEKGFTLIELLVVILIIGILAAIAIPSFLNQRSKANDASAKELARTAQTVAETYATDHNGFYEAVAGTSFTVADLVGIEPTIQTTSASANAYLDPTAANTFSTPSSYQVTTISVPTNDTFTIARSSTGIVARTCTIPTGANPGGCQNTNGGTSGTW